MDGTRRTERRKEMQLVRRARNGEQDAWRAILGKHESHLLGAVARKIGWAEAEDVVQETFLCLLRKIDVFDGRIPLSAWLQMVANRRCADWYRKRIRLQHGEIVGDLVSGLEQPDTIAIRGETVAAVRHEIGLEVERMKRAKVQPGRCAAVSSLLDGNTPADVADEFDCSPGQAASWSFDARRRLRGSPLLAELASDD
jgi:RNA polymerase sigma factor (sigma-70 family)